MAQWTNRGGPQPSFPVVPEKERMTVFLAEVWSAAADAGLPALTWSGSQRFGVFARLCVPVLAAPAHWALRSVDSAPGPSGTGSSQAQSPLFLSPALKRWGNWG